MAPASRWTRAATGWWPRPEFEPTLWTAVPIPIPGHQTSIEQRWFVGAHSDGGGGERSRRRAPLSVLAREWIADEARAAGLDVEEAQRPFTDDEWKSPYGDSFATWLRRIAWLVPGREPYLRPVNTTECETLDPSALQRWQGDPEHHGEHGGGRRRACRVTGRDSECAGVAATASTPGRGVAGCR
ncbi:phospholipase effector Tle1 domain-containing protein [Pseudonocardia bannensis]|uniref:DUF2235 domain-containing protein n=1 Tax=Pseudonocardia bannensis TaxID=630973 RepID=A0A848DHC2_9PSEU|nr:DUF2235 domain-containing protein [Pseudonocardia bannensis]NMH92057.1 DUF2235 domain-containing protein [Pseudonocardia bannensis]